MRWIAVKFGANIHDPQWIHSLTFNYDDVLYFPLAPPCFRWNISRRQHGLQWNLVQTFMISNGYVLLTVMIFWHFLQCHHEVGICLFKWNISTTMRWIAMMFVHIWTFFVCHFSRYPLAIPGAQTHLRLSQRLNHCHKIVELLAWL